jgi:hypothetical protein
MNPLPIKEHEFNSRWWGSSAGVITSAEFFAAPEAVRRAALEAYAWTEFQTPASQSIDLKELIRSGFTQVDTQIIFRLDLTKVAPPAGSCEFALEFADEQPFAVTAEEMAPFRHERFLALPGATLERVAERYVLWSADLIAQNPASCLRIRYEGRTQGWFLASAAKGRLMLTLAMLAREATLGGAVLYRAACHAFAGRGHRLGEAGFSVSNTPVHNIYAQMGARFLEPRRCYLRLP